MNCRACGNPIPSESKACHRCGAPIIQDVPPPGRTQSMGASLTMAPPVANPSAQADPFAQPGISFPGARPVQKSSGPGKPLIAALAGLALILAIGSAAILKHKENLASQAAESPNTGEIANAPTMPPVNGGLANAPAASADTGGLANAPASPPAPTGGLASAPAAPVSPGAIANAPTAPAPPGGLTNNPSGIAPKNAEPLDDIGPYLDALKKIEEKRRNFNDQMTGQAVGGRKGASLPDALGQMLAQQMNSASGEGGDAGAGDLLGKLRQVFAAVANQYVGLVQEVEQLNNVPGVPASCKDLQGYYKAALTPFVKLANTARSDPLTFLQGAMDAQSEESKRLGQSEQALTDVCKSHNIQPPFEIKDTEGSSVGGGNDLMTPAYKPGHP